MIKSFGDMMKQAQKVQKQMGELQEKLAEERYEASSGGGLVKVVVDGKQIVREIKLGEELLKETDVTVIEDLVMTALGEAQRTSSEKMSEAYAKLTGGFGMPF